MRQQAPPEEEYPSLGGKAGPSAAYVPQEPAPAPAAAPGGGRREREREEAPPRLSELVAPAAPEALHLAYTPQRAVRPGQGTAGRQMKIKANWFDVMYTPTTSLVPESGLIHETEVTLADEQVTRRLSVTIRLVDIIPITALNDFLQGKESELAYHAIQALDVVLKHRMSYSTTCLPGEAPPHALGRAFFFHDANVRSIGGGAEVWLGYQQSLRPCQTGLALNVDMVATAMLEAGELTDFMYEKIGDVRGAVTPIQRRTLDKALRGVKVKARHNGFKKAVRAICKANPYEEKFFKEDSGQEMTIAEYFKARAQYGITLRNRDLPCIAVGNGKVILPPELCSIVPGQRRSKLNELQARGWGRVGAHGLANYRVCTRRQTAEMIKTAAQHPDQKVRSIDDVVATKARFGSDPNMQARAAGRAGGWGFGMSVGGRQMEVVARVLPNPRLSYGSPPNYDPKGFGGWNLKNVRFLNGTQNGSWAIACFANPRFAEEDLTRPTGRNGPTFIREYCANVAMKVNTKLGGCNVRLADPQAIPVIGGAPFMIFGADVTHPMGGEDMPSIAAVVGSLDAVASRYAARVSMQTGRQEIIVDLKGELGAMVKGLLSEFYAVTSGRRPERLVFYRDGVSEGQFKEVYYSEYSALREACKEMGDPAAEYAPPITFIVVQKRHHTRIFPLPTDQQNRDRSGNCLPGTVVDTAICHPHEFDFYLNSHAGIQGTSRPTHYHVLVDENRFSADQLQGMTYRLCYLFCRCTRSISVCPPAQYAHLAAFRGRVLCRGGDSETGSVSSGRTSGSGNVEFLPVNSALSRVMFYV
eukprot:scaffold20.g7698.t1